jgi:hypothetical protein
MFLLHVICNQYGGYCVEKFQIQTEQENWLYPQPYVSIPVVPLLKWEIGVYHS